MSIRIALAGNPNCGKTTLFNALTGSNQYVGNWPGVTVEKKTGKLKDASGEEVNVTDLPGVYSLSPYTLEEVVTRDFILKENPDTSVRIPMIGETRSLNLSNSVVICLYEALRQNHFDHMKLEGQLHRLSWDE